MATRTKDQNTLSLGDWNSLCDICGFKFKASDLKRRWDGMMCCKEDWEPKHPSLYYKAPKEDTSVPWSRPDNSTDPSAEDNTDISGNTFPPTENTTATDVGTKPDLDGDGLVEGNFLYNGEAQEDSL